MYANNCVADKRCCPNILKMSAASNATAGFLNAQHSANIDDVIKILDVVLKSVTLAGTAGGIAFGIWKYSEISAAFSRIVKGKGTSADEEMARNAIHAGGAPVEEAVHTAVRALRAIHEVGAGDRLEEIVRRSENRTT